MECRASYQNSQEKGGRVGLSIDVWLDFTSKFVWVILIFISNIRNDDGHSHLFG